MIFAASCTLRGSPAPMPGALFALRVLVITPKLVELDSDAPGFAQLIVLNTLKISQRSCTDAPPLSFVVLKTDRSTLFRCNLVGVVVGCTMPAYGSPTR